MIAKLGRVRTSTLEIAYEDSRPAAYHQHRCRGGGLAMKRRDFIGLVGGAAASWPLAARAQQTRRVGVLLNTSENDDESKARILAFQASLEKQGWIIGRNIQ